MPLEKKCVFDAPRNFAEPLPLIFCLAKDKFSSKPETSKLGRVKVPLRINREKATI